MFLQWEGVEAKLKGVDLNVFRVCDYGMPYAVRRRERKKMNKKKNLKREK